MRTFVVGASLILITASSATAQEAPKTPEAPQADLKPQFEEIDGPVADAASEKKWDVDVGTEARLRSLRIDPVELSGTEVNLIHWSEMRARFDAVMRRKGVGALTVQLDALDGVLLGDFDEIDEPFARDAHILTLTCPPGGSASSDPMKDRTV